MARARTIKPSIMVNEDLAELSPSHRLLYVYLWMLADKAGRLEDRPKRIKTQALPYDDVDVDRLLHDLWQAGFIVRYESDDVAVIEVCNFAKHQNPHPKEKESELPEKTSTKSTSHGKQFNSMERNVISPFPSFPSSSLLPPSPEGGAQTSSSPCRAAPNRLHDDTGRGLGDTPEEQWQNSTDIYRASRVIDELNKLAGSNYRARDGKGGPTAAARDVIALVKKGYTWDDFVAVLDSRVAKWKGTEMEAYLRPATLFRLSKFESYLGQSEKVAG